MGIFANILIVFQLSILIFLEFSLGSLRLCGENLVTINSLYVLKNVYQKFRIK